MAAVACTLDSNWRYAPKGKLLALHEMQPDGTTQVKWSVPFVRKRFYGEGSNADTDEIRRRTPPEAMAVAGDIALIAEFGKLMLFDLKDGTKLQTLDLPAHAAQAGIAAAEGRVYVSCLDGSLMRFE
jgi:hypothetical protein